MLLGLDAGFSARNATGVALMNPEIKRVVAATLVRRDVNRTGLDAMQDVANRATEWAKRYIPGGTRISAFITEMPQIYPGERKDPNVALVPLVGILGCVSGILPSAAKRVSYLPRQWKGTLDGDLFVRERILPRLDARERALIDAIMPAGLRHNAADAAGLLLHYVGRLEVGRVIHNEPALIRHTEVG